MGLAKRSFSPPAPREDDASESDSPEPLRASRRQLDIRTFFSKTSGCRLPDGGFAFFSKASRLPAAFPTEGGDRKRLNGTFGSSAGDASSTWPLLQLPGQTNLRAFFKGADARTEHAVDSSMVRAFEEHAVAERVQGDISHNAYAFEEEAAIAMGLSLSLEDEEYSQQAGFDDFQDLHEVAESWHDDPCDDGHDAEEEAAILMGLSLGLEDEETDEAELDDFQQLRDLEEAWFKVKGLSSENETMLEYDDKRAYADEEEAAIAMGLSLSLQDEEDPEEEEADLHDFRRVQELEEAWSAAEALSRADDAMLVGTGIHQEPTSAVGKAAALATSLAVAGAESPEPGLPCPATPPKRALQAKETPPQEAKRRRLGEACAQGRLAKSGEKEQPPQEEPNNDAAGNEPGLRAAGFGLHAVLRG